MTAGQLDRLIGELAARGLTVATAESLTGGLVAAAITAVPGASAVFRGGAVVYATESKAAVLGVSEVLLARQGPVDPDVAVALAGGVCRLFGADVGVATTGVAGPAPQGGHDAGTVFVAAAWPSRPAERVIRLRLSGDRHAIRSQSVAAAVNLLADIVE